MSNRNTKLGLYLAKIETTEGTDAVPVQGSNVIALSESFEPDWDHAFKPDNENTVKGVDLTAGEPLIPAGKIYSWSKRSFFRGTGTAPTASNRPELDPWFRSAGLGVTFDATPGSEKATYTPANTSLESLTEYDYKDGVLRKGVGARADLSLSFDVGGPLVIEHASQGILLSDADGAVPTTPTFEDTEWPIATDMTTFTIDGWTAGVIRRFECSLGNNIQRRDGVKSTGGVAGFRIAGRNPTFSVTLEEPTRATKDFTALVNNRTAVALAWLLGAGSYLRGDFSASRAFIRKVTPSNDNGLALLTLQGVLRGATPFSLAVR